MDDQSDDRPEDRFGDPRGGPVGAGDDDMGTDPGPAWTGLGASRGPRSPAEGVRIIGAEEAAAALESGQVSPRVPDDAPRFGDVPVPPSGPRPGIRFPGADPQTVAKPPVVAPPPDAGPRRSVWDAPAGDPFAPAAPTTRAGRFEELVARAEERAAERGIGAQSPAGGDAWPPPPPRSSTTYGDTVGVGGPGGPTGAGGAWPPETRTASDDSWPPPPPVPGDVDDAWPPPPPSVGEVDDAWPPPPPSYTSRDVDDAWPPPPGAAGQPLPPAAGADLWPPDDGDDVGFEREPAGVSPWDTFDEPLPSGEYPRVSASSMPAGDNSGSIPLPHWTEPATGEVPVILADQPPPQAGPPDELGSWSTLSSGPRWRDQATDWDEADFHEAILDDQSTRVGALDQSRDDAFSFDEPPAAAPTAPARTGGRAGTQVQAPTAPPQPGGEQSGGDADLTTRVVVGLVVAGVVLGAAVIGPRALVLVVAVAVTMGAAELYQGLRTRGYQPATLLGLAATASVVGAAYWQGERALPLVTAILLVFSFLWYLAGVVKGRPTMNIAVSVMAYLYVGFLGSYAALIFHIRSLPSGILEPKHATGILLGAVLATVAHDVGSYFVGRYAGKTPLAPTISPHKTFEGLVGGTLVTLAVCVLLIGSLAPWDRGKAFLLALVVIVFAPLGDLCESMIKRDLNVKDMGNTLPGHGGILDRIDALLFVIPATYYLALVLFPRGVKTVSLVGSTGSIGRQTLDVVRAEPDRYRVVALGASSSVDALAAQVAEFLPPRVAIADPSRADDLRAALAALLPPGVDVEVEAGPDSLAAISRDADVVVNGVVGFAGLTVTLAALRAGHRLALANKESLIAAGPVVAVARRTPGAEIVPVDSEHCAVHQCLRANAVGPDGEAVDRLARIVLTASGGPFRGRSRSDLGDVSISDALAHPTWSMGPKITVDSSTLLNKGLEVIEAHELFEVDYDRIEVVVHPQSIVHSMVEFTDGAVVAQLSMPDMRLPIGYALAYPDRSGVAFGAIDWSRACRLDFEPPDLDAFPCLGLAYAAGRTGGTAPAWLNAANEVAVAAFLEGALRWSAIAEVIEETLDGHDGTDPVDADVVIEADRKARELARRAVERRVAAA